MQGKDEYINRKNTIHHLAEKKTIKDINFL